MYNREFLSLFLVVGDLYWHCFLPLTQGQRFYFLSSLLTVASGLHQCLGSDRVFWFSLETQSFCSSEWDSMWGFMLFLQLWLQMNQSFSNTLSHDCKKNENNIFTPKHLKGTHGSIQIVCTQETSSMAEIFVSIWLSCLMQSKSSQRKGNQKNLSSIFRNFPIKHSQQTVTNNIKYNLCRN